MERTVPFLNGCISLVAFIVALSLVLYMLVVFVAGAFDTVLLMSETIFMSSEERQSIFTVLNGDFLYNLAFLIVLMKAFGVLTGYMRQHVVDVKAVVELFIVAAALELLFNAAAHSDHTQFVLALTAAAFFGVYALRYHARAILERMAPIDTTPEEAIREVAAQEPAPSRARAKAVKSATKEIEVPVKRIAKPKKLASK
jgi:uncharacterized membrane protein (DUF373 family)